MRHEKMMKQVEEGALLVENHKLEVLLDDDATTRRNRNRQYLSKVITIQRAWRAYLARVTEAQEQVRRAKEAGGGALLEEELSETESAHGGGDMTLSTPEENTEDSVAGRGAGSRSRSGSRLREPSQERVLDSRKSPLRQLRDAECESVVSDYSEVSAPLRDIESELQFVKCDELHRDNFSIFPCLNPLPSHAIEREPGESDQAFSKRVRKINYLSLAQEFAELKKVNAAALPFDLHKTQGQDGSVKESSPSSEASSSFDEAEYYLTESAITSPMDSDKELEDHASDLEDDGGATRGDASGARDRSSKQEKGDTAPSLDGTPKDRASEGGEGQKAGQGEGLAPKDRDSSKAGHGRDHVVSNNASRKTRSREGSKHRSSSRSRTGAVSSRSREGSRGERRRHASGGGRTREGVRTPRSRDASAGTPSGGSRSRDASKDSPRDQDSEAGDFEVYNVAATVPSMDWDTLEQQLALAAAAEEQREQSRQSEREQIRQKLAMGLDEDYYYGERAFRKPNLQTRLQSGMNLQICFMNEAACDDDLASSPQDTGHVPRPPAKSSPPRTLPSKGTSSGGRGQGEEEEDQDFFKKQARLQEEATLALAQAGTMARMQLQVEKQMKKKSPIADMLGLPTLEDGRRQKLTRKLLSEMNLAQIQVLVNDFHTQIENLNEELVHLLLERDDLHMEQDSMLVDIEDHSRRAQEYLEKVYGKEAVQKQREAISKK